MEMTPAAACSPPWEGGLLFFDAVCATISANSMKTGGPEGEQTYDQWLRRADVDAVAQMCRFFMQDDPVHQTLRRIAAKSDELGVAYAIAGGMALGAHRFVRATVHVDILVDTQGLQIIHENLDGRGFVPPFSGSRNLKDVETGVRIEFLVHGQFPGDGKPKPVAFPDPSEAGDLINGIRYLRLTALIEIKLASGMTNSGRLRDLADVQELIRVLGLSRDFSQQLNPYVRGKFEELWGNVADNPDPEE
jgi:hypothetical protein